MEKQLVEVKDVTANPAPLGLLGFGMTTVLLNLHNAGCTELNSTILSMGVFMGGIAQMIAGVQEWKKGNTFGATAFTSYGAFWLSLVCIWLLPKSDVGAGLQASRVEMGWYLLLWGVYTSFMFISTFKHTRQLRLTFGLLVVLFFLLAAGDFTGNETITRIAGWDGLLCGLSAIYGCVAQIINQDFKRTVLPL